MRVLLINSVCGIRSTGRICTDLADTLIENGHECEIAYGRENVPEKYCHISYRIGNKIDVRLHALASRIFDCAGFCSQKATKKLIEEIESFKPDVIHLHNIHGYYINIDILFRFLAKTGIPVVWTLHDCWAFTGHCSYFAAVNCEQWRTGCRSCMQKNRYPASFVFDRSKWNFERKKELFTSVENMTIVTPSRWLAGLVRESFLGKYEVKVIPNGIDLETFHPTESTFKEEFGIKHKTLVLGVASVWDERKGFKDFLKLSDMLGEDYAVVLVGVSDKQKKALPKNVIGITRTNSTEELAKIYSSADVFVNLTYEDNYPTVNLEAQACGTSVLTYRTGGSVENVPPTSIVEQGNLDEVVKKIKAYNKLERAFVPKKIEQYSKYVELYEETIK